MLAVVAFLLSACATTQSTRSPAHIEIQEQVGFTITEDARISGAVRADYEQALTYLQQGRHEDGIALLETVAEAAPDLSAPRIDLGIAHHRAGDLEASIRFIRASDKPLAAYIFTRDPTAEARFLEKVSSGSACINDTMMFMTVDELPFGGVGPSGMGNYSGEYGFRTFSHMKAVMKRGWWPDFAVRYAPFTARKFKLLRKLR